MKNANVKTNLTRKAAAIASAVMTLSTVTVLAMAPMSQAHAANDPNNRSVRVQVTPKEICDPRTKTCWVQFRAEGGGRTPIQADQNAISAIQCPGIASISDKHRVNPQPMLSPGNGRWFYQDYTFKCNRPMSRLFF